MPGLVVVGERVLTEHGVGPAAIFVEGGRIRRVEALAPGAAADAASLGLLGLGDAELVQAGELLVTPGVVDAHVHINEPGRTEWEGFETATEAAMSIFMSETIFNPEGFTCLIGTRVFVEDTFFVIWM